MRQFFLTLWMLLMPLSFYGQANSLKIKGHLLDSNGEGLPSVRVMMYRVADDQMVKGVISDIEGRFEVEAPSGQYYLRMTSMGTEERNQPLSRNSGLVDLGTIKLKDSKEIGEIQVIGDRSQMSLEIDKRVFNVSSDLSSQGGSAADILDKIPSVSVDAEGNVSLRGNQNVQILIDGKPSGFASSAEALEQLQGDLIENVEVITNASAKYEAQGEAGIINIVLKKNNQQGLNGSATIKGGYVPHDGLGVNGNWRSGKWNVFGSLDYEYRRVDGRSSTHQRLENDDTSFIYIQGYKHDRRRHQGSYRLGADYQLNEYNVIGMTFGGRLTRGKGLIERTYDNYTIADVFLDRDTRMENLTLRKNMQEGNLDYTHYFKNKKNVWKSTLRLYSNKDLDDSKYDESSSARPVDTFLEQSNAYTTQRLALLQSDLTWNFNETAKLEAGLRGQIRDFDNQFGYRALIQSEWQENPFFNDRFNYNEKVYAAYLQGSNTYGPLSWQVGLRGEYSEIFTKQYSEQVGRTRSYLNFFPNLALSYAANEQHTLQFSYSRRINRPGQWALMPFLRFGDNRAMRVGNPDIDPELTDAYEMGFLNDWDKVSLLSSIYYRHTKNKFDRISYLGEDGIIYSKMMNIFNRNAFGLEFNGSYNPTNWLTFSTGLNFFKASIEGKLGERDFGYQDFSWSGRANINVSFPDQWRFQLSGSYAAPTVSAQGRNLARYFMDFGMSKNVLKNQGTITLSVNDVFNTRRWRGTVNTPDIQSETMFQWNQRNYRLSFTYRLNQKYKEPKSVIDIEPGEEGN